MVMGLWRRLVSFSSLWLSHTGPLQWFKPRHICQGHFYCRALQLGCATLKHIYIDQHSQGPGDVKGSFTNRSSISMHLESFCQLNTERWFVTGAYSFHLEDDRMGGLVMDNECYLKKYTVRSANSKCIHGIRKRTDWITNIHWPQGCTVLRVQVTGPLLWALLFIVWIENWSHDTNH